MSCHDPVKALDHHKSVVSPIILVKCDASLGLFLLVLTKFTIFFQTKFDLTTSKLDAQSLPKAHTTTSNANSWTASDFRVFTSISRRCYPIVVDNKVLPYSC